MERVLAAAAAILHELKAHLGKLFFVLVCMVCNFLTLRTFEFYKIVLGHTFQIKKSK